MFEKLLSRGERRFGRYFGIPKLMMILCIGMGVTYVADYLLAAYNISLSYYLMFDREAIFHGQIWRLVSFIFMPPSSSPVFLLISLMFYWYLGTSLQNTWGTFRFTVYYLCGMLGAILAGLITGYATNTYLNLSLFLACAVLFPETEVNLIIIPVKMKWLSLAGCAAAADEQSLGHSGAGDEPAQRYSVLLWRFDPAYPRFPPPSAVEAQLEVTKGERSGESGA